MFITIVNCYALCSNSSRELDNSALAMNCSLVFSLASIFVFRPRLQPRFYPCISTSPLSSFYPCVSTSPLSSFYPCVSTSPLSSFYPCVSTSALFLVNLSVSGLRPSLCQTCFSALQYSRPRSSCATSVLRNLRTRSRATSGLRNAEDSLSLSQPGCD